MNVKVYSAPELLMVLILLDIDAEVPAYEVVVVAGR